jgi:hypothetical protein
LLEPPQSGCSQPLFAPPLAKRRDELDRYALADRLHWPEEHGVTVADLSRHEPFITAGLHASQVAMRTHQREQLEALRNAVTNAALPLTRLMKAVS